MSSLLPHPWDLYGRPTPTDASLEGVYQCDHKYSSCRDAEEHLDMLEDDLEFALIELSAAESHLEDAQADVDGCYNEVEDLKERIRLASA
jgi:hypothetical protein